MSTREKQERIETLYMMGFSYAEARKFVENCESRPAVTFISLAQCRSWGFDLAQSQRSFGVEIECLVNRQKLINAALFEGRNISSEGYNHNDRRDIFKIVSDSSVMGEDPNEVVSPVLVGEDGVTHLKDVCTALANARAKVNKTCGLHVHISAEGMTEDEQMMVFNLYAKAEKVIDTFMPKSRRGNENCYCRSIANYIGKSKREVIWLGRYHKVNLTALFNHGTIEFRQHSGSVEYEKIKNWVSFCAGMVDYVKHHIIDIDRVQINSIDDIMWIDSETKEFYKARKAHFDSQISR